jgi:hypothetical protein
MIEEFKNINLILKDLRKFGITFGIILVIIFSFLLSKQKIDSFLYFGIPLIFILLGILLPKSLGPFYRIWMSFAIIMQWIVTHIILTLLFYLIITPIGAMSRIFRKDFLSLRYKENVETYWEKRETKNLTLKDYERQF